MVNPIVKLGVIREVCSFLGLLHLIHTVFVNYRTTRFQESSNHVLNRRERGDMGP